MPVTAAKPFDFGEQAETLGGYVGRFAELAKLLNVAMLRSADTTSHIQSIVGAGPFNRAAMKNPHLSAPTIAEDTVLFGDELRKERASSKNHHGLFAAFAAIHHPLLGFAKLLLTDLGQRGFKCKVTHGGHTFSIPLHELKMDFNENNEIYTTSDYKERDAQGKATGEVLPAGFVLLHNVASDFRPYADAAGSFNCNIVDAGGKSTGIVLGPKLLWTGITSRGKNIYGENSKLADVLMILGIDDMEDANRYVIEAVKDLERTHKYDSKPLWDRVMKSAREQLLPHLDMMAVTREMIAEGHRDDRPLPHVMRSIIDPYNVATIDRVVDFFGVTLPELRDDQKKMADDVARGLANAARR